MRAPVQAEKNGWRHQQHPPHRLRKRNQQQWKCSNCWPRGIPQPVKSTRVSLHVILQLIKQLFSTYPIGTGAGELAELHDEVVVICHGCWFRWLARNRPVLGSGAFKRSWCGVRAGYVMSVVF